MWIFVARQERKDATSWRSRRLLAAIDAVAWPAAYMVAAWRLRAELGLVCQMAFVVASVSLTLRLKRAVLSNDRYFFTTTRWLRVGLALLLIGYVLKWTAQAFLPGHVTP